MDQAVAPKYCPADVIQKFGELGIEASKVQEKYEIFIKNNPTGKISYGDAMTKIEEYVKARWPNADSMAVTYALYPAFDPQNTGQIDFYNICRGFCLLAVTKAAIRAKLFFNIIDTDGSGTISESEFEVFLKCVNAIDESNYTPEEIKAKSAEIFTLFKEKTGETEMTLKHILQLVQDRDPAKKPTTPKSTTPKSDVDENLVTLHALGDTHVTKDIK